MCPPSNARPNGNGPAAKLAVRFASYQCKMATSRKFIVIVPALEEFVTGETPSRATILPHAWPGDGPTEAAPDESAPLVFRQREIFSAVVKSPRIPRCGVRPFPRNRRADGIIPRHAFLILQFSPNP